jgi:uncharacterized DUF497 family protein
MIFAWDDKNREHVSKHNVSPLEAEEVVRSASEPFPRRAVGNRFSVWGQTQNGRYLQVIYVLKRPHEVSYESLALVDWLEIEQRRDVRVLRVIHAMDLTDKMKKQLRG